MHSGLEIVFFIKKQLFLTIFYYKIRIFPSNFSKIETLDNQSGEFLLKYFPIKVR